MLRQKLDRSYSRLKPKNMLYSKMTISRVGFKSVKTRHTRVRLIDVSPGGLKFSSSLKLPVTPDVILEFSIYTTGQCVFLQGHAVYRLEKSRNMYVYGICFDNVDESMHALLVKIINIMKTHTRNYLYISN
jgi:hypothetical protein